MAARGVYMCIDMITTIRRISGLCTHTSASQYTFLLSQYILLVVAVVSVVD